MICISFRYCSRSICLFFFFKQKTAYEFRLSLVGSEMCIRDSHGHVDHANSVVYLKSEFGSKVIMPEYEACFFDNPRFFIEKVIRAKSVNYEMMYPSQRIKVDYVVKKEEELILDDKKFKVERLPGHSFNHCGFSTPDNVIYLGD